MADLQLFSTGHFLLFLCLLNVNYSMKRRYGVLGPILLLGRVCIFLICGATTLGGQISDVAINTLDELERADRLTKAGLYDQALSQLEPIYVCLEKQGRLNERRGISVRQQLAFIYRKTNEEEKAVGLALPLVEAARRAGCFREQAYALLTLAAVYTGSKQFDKSYETLLQCGALPAEPAIG